MAGTRASAETPSFAGRVDEENRFTEDGLEIMQVNVGRRCNLRCKHCHIDAGPDRTELMTRETMEACLSVFAGRGFKTLDITGGAPEMNPHLAWLLEQAHALGADLMVRSNLVILDLPEYRQMADCYAEYGVTLVASLPHYTQKAMEKQRGSNTFDQVIAQLQQLNARGYGKGGGLEIDLVYNPGGAFLPPDQASLEREYKQKLGSDFGVSFDHLFAITNNPLGRFGEFLERSGNLEGYMGKLVNAFNPGTLPSMMCRNQLSVGWDGRLYDCDFNQAADLACTGATSIFDYAGDPSLPLKREIRFGDHCYACCAGAGSSCGGATA